MICCRSQSVLDSCPCLCRWRWCQVGFGHLKGVTYHCVDLRSNHEACRSECDTMKVWCHICATLIICICIHLFPSFGLAMNWKKGKCRLSYRTIGVTMLIFERTTPGRISLFKRIFLLNFGRWNCNFAIVRGMNWEMKWTCDSLWVMSRLAFWELHAEWTDWLGKTPSVCS